jgi:hypothetical protein
MQMPFGKHIYAAYQYFIWQLRPGANNPKAITFVSLQK